MCKPEKYYIHKDRETSTGCCLCKDVYECDTDCQFGDTNEKIDNVYTDDELNNRGFFANYFIRMDENGYPDADHLCIKGPRSGEVWRFLSGAEYFGRVSSSYSM